MTHLVSKEYIDKFLLFNQCELAYGLNDDTLAECLKRSGST
jgi:hypothetical protein